MNRYLTTLLLFLGGIALPLGGQAQSLIPTDLKHLLGGRPGGQLVITDHRLKVELRRAGGPREAVVEELLEALAEGGDPGWGVRALALCRSRAIECRDLTRSLDLLSLSMAGTAMENDRDSSFEDAFRAEANLAALGREGRLRVYQEVLRRDPPQKVKAPLSIEDAMARALDERMFELLPLLVAAKPRLEPSVGRHLGLRVDVLSAAYGASPESALLGYIQRAVDEDVAARLPTAAQGQAVCSSDACYAALFAMDHLRRADAAEALGQLKSILASYGTVREALMHGYETRVRVAREKGKSLWNLTEPRAEMWLGLLGEKLAELIGDLRDRGTERAALGRKTDSELVEEVEEVMEQRGLLRTSSRVTAPSSAAR
ncbi:MAG: hypothetical protein AB2L07_12960 [Thermoanaerobaculaceae bacterium]